MHTNVRETEKKIRTTHTTSDTTRTTTPNRRSRDAAEGRADLNAAFGRVLRLAPQHRRTDALLAFFVDLLLVASCDASTVAGAIGGMTLVCSLRGDLDDHQHTANMVSRYADARALLEQGDTQLSRVALVMADLAATSWNLSDREGSADAMSAILIRALLDSDLGYLIDSAISRSEGLAPADE